MSTLNTKPGDAWPAPEGVQGRLWQAVRALHREIERIDGEAMNAAQVAQDSEEGEFTWCVEVSRFLSERLTKGGAS